MQTNLLQEVLQSPDGDEAERILRACVHCGFCTATCPTYQLLGDELDGPRGRIYQIKQMLEGEAVSPGMQLHLDRCLTCRACETTCPSGVEYARLLDIGRNWAETHQPRPLTQRWQRRLLRWVLPYPARLKPLLKLGQLLKPILPSEVRAKIPPRVSLKPNLNRQHARRLLILEGCAQSVMRPQTSAALERLLDRLGISVQHTAEAGCCGALSHHLSATEEARQMARKNIDAWWPLLNEGAEAVLFSASGCGVHLKDYGHLLRQDPDYAEKARFVAEHCFDFGEFLLQQGLQNRLSLKPEAPTRVAFHSPCTLQHGLKSGGQMATLLAGFGIDLQPVKDSHLCCGSAGSYSLLQSNLAKQLRQRKLAALQESEPEIILTANIGCQLHLGGEAKVKVWHWIEYLERYSV